MKLDPIVVGLVLSAALMHAGWNALVKSDRDRLIGFSIVMGTGGVVALPLLPFVAMPAAPAWKFLIASTLIHYVYYAVLLRAYAHGDLSHVYPIARGLGPLLVAVFSLAFGGENLTGSEIAGVAATSLGIASLAFAGGVPTGLTRQATLWAFATGCTIGAYTVVDGLGGRASGDVIGYIAWLNVLETPGVVAIAIWRRGWRVIPYAREHGLRAVGGGVIATLGYGIAIWALSQGPMAHVAALRESSVLFAALIGTLLMGERFGRRRVAAATLIVLGLVAMNLRT